MHEHDGEFHTQPQRGWAGGWPAHHDESSNAIVRGLVVNRFNGDGIKLTNASGIAIEGNFIGLDAAGVQDFGNAREGILITNSANNVVGGILATQRNFISGNNLNGVSINGTNATNNVIVANVIGLGLTNGPVAIH